MLACWASLTPVLPELLSLQCHLAAWMQLQCGPPALAPLSVHAPVSGVDSVRRRPNAFFLESMLAVCQAPVAQRSLDVFYIRDSVFACLGWFCHFIIFYFILFFLAMVTDYAALPTAGVGMDVCVCVYVCLCVS
jgi:hypothetical protein